MRCDSMSLDPKPVLGWPSIFSLPVVSAKAMCCQIPRQFSRTIPAPPPYNKKIKNICHFIGELEGCDLNSPVPT